LTLASRRRLTGNTAFGFIKRMIVTPVLEISRTRWTLWPNCPIAPQDCRPRLLPRRLDHVYDGRALPVDAAVAYHGADTEKYLGEVDNLRAPLLMHLGEEDEFISKPAQAQIKAALRSKPNSTVYSYPGQRHAFARHNGARYNAAAAALTNGRTSEFLCQQLRRRLACKVNIGSQQSALRGRSLGELELEGRRILYRFCTETVLLRPLTTSTTL
jgi:hypothetical protein